MDNNYDDMILMFMYDDYNDEMGLDNIDGKYDNIWCWW